MKMPMIAQLRSRWRPSADSRPHLYGAMIAFRRGLAQVEDITAQRERLSADANLTAAGKKAALRSFVEQQMLKGLKEAETGLAKAAADVAAKRAAIGAPSIDRSDIAGALLRQEIRSVLRQQPAGAALALVAGSKDPRVLDAVLEAPAELSGLSAGELAVVEDRLVAARHPEEFAQIEEDEEAIALARSALDLAKMEIAAATDAQDERALNEMLKAA
jgi:hypothetical protein